MIYTKRVVLKAASVTVLLSTVSLLLLPLIFTVWGSFIDIHGVMKMPPKITAHYTFQNYALVFRGLNFRWPVNTLFLTFMVVGGSLAISAVTGYGLMLKDSKAVKLLILSAIIVPRYALIIPQVIIMRHLGLINTLLACSLTIVVTPLHIFMAEAYFRSFPRSLIDAGRVEGLSYLGVLFRIILPNSKALLVCLGLLKTVDAWNDYLWQYLILSGENKKTLLVGLLSWLKTRGSGIIEINPVGISLAVSVVLMLPFLLLFSMGSRYFMYELKGVD